MHWTFLPPLGHMWQMVVSYIALVCMGCLYPFYVVVEYIPKMTLCYDAWLRASDAAGGVCAETTQTAGKSEVVGWISG